MIETIESTLFSVSLQRLSLTVDSAQSRKAYSLPKTNHALFHSNFLLVAVHVLMRREALIIFGQNFILLIIANLTRGFCGAIDSVDIRLVVLSLNTEGFMLDNHSISAPRF